MAVIKRQSYGRTMRDTDTANFAGVATKVKIIHRNQQNLLSLRSLLKERKKMQSILNLDKDILQITLYVW